MKPDTRTRGVLLARQVGLTINYCVGARNCEANELLRSSNYILKSVKLLIITYPFKLI